MQSSIRANLDPKVIEMFLEYRQTHLELTQVLHLSDD